MKGTIHFVDAKTAVPITIRNYSYLMVPDEKGDNVLNPESLVEKKGFAELESVLQNTRRNSDGTLNLANTPPDDSEREKWSLAM